MSKTTKIVAGLLGFAMVFTLVVGVSASKARAQTAGYTFTRDLTVGSTGADVTALQSILNAKGYLMVAPTGYFGALTKAAVMQWQASMGLPNTGYFGPMSRAAIASVVVTPTTPSTPSNPSTGNGDEGQFKNIKRSGGLDSSIEEGDEDVKVLGARLEAEDSDMTITRVDVEFTSSGTGSTRLNRYVDEVSLMLGNKVLDTQDASDADKDGSTYSFRFTGLKGVVAEGKTADLYVLVTAIDNIDTGDIHKEWTVKIPSDGIRAMDEAGISDTYVSDSEESALTRSLSFDDADTASLDITSDDEDNEDRTVSVDESSDTNDVEVLRFTLEGDDADTLINSLTFRFSSTTDGADITDIISNVTLEVDGDDIDSADVDSDGEVTFDDLDLTIEDGDEVEVVLRVDLNEMGDNESNYANGDKFSVTLSSNDVDAEDADTGDTVNPSGSAVGGDITLRTEGTSLTGGTMTTSVDSHGDDPDTGEYTIEFKVNAFGDDIYVPLTVNRNASSTVGAAYQIETSNGSATTTGGTANAVLARVSGGTETTSNGTTYLRVREGQSATLRLTVSFDPTVSGFYRAQLLTSAFRVGSATGSYDSETASPEADFQTGFVNVQ